MEVELQEYFGSFVVVQLRDAVARILPGKETQSAVITSNGQPAFDMERGGPIMRRQIEPVDTPDYQLTYVCRMLPALAGRVHLCYEHEGHAMRMTVRPADIVAVSFVDGKLPSKIESAS